MRKLAVFSILCGWMALLCTGCGENGLLFQSRRSAVLSSPELQFQTPAEGAPIAVIETTLGTIRAVLYPEYAPMAVANFSGLAQQGYYNNLPFHRIAQDFVIQTGDATGTGTGGSTIWNNAPYPIEISDVLHHYSGALGMAHASGNSTSNLSQFYIVQTPQNSVDKAAAQTLESLGVRADVISTYRSAGGAPYLDNLYTVFGQVYDGLDIVDQIGSTPCDENGQPKETVSVLSISIGTYSAAAAASSAASGAGSAASSAS